MQNKDKPSVIVQDLCKKLKLQLDQLGIAIEKPAPGESEDTVQRKDLFKALQDQLAELSR